MAAAAARNVCAESPNIFCGLRRLVRLKALLHVEPRYLNNAESPERSGLYRLPDASLLATVSPVSGAGIYDSSETFRASAQPRVSDEDYWKRTPAET